MAVPSLLLLSVTFGIVTCQLSFNPGNKKIPASPEVKTDSVDSRLGLLASTLGRIISKFQKII